MARQAPGIALHPASGAVASIPMKDIPPLIVSANAVVKGLKNIIG